MLIDVAKKAPANLGDVVVTTAGALQAEHIFHVITIGAQPDEKPPMLVVEQATNKCLALLSALGLNSIAFPAIGTGLARYNPDDVALKMSEVITEYLKNTEAQLDVSIYLYNRFGINTALEYIAFFEQFASRIGVAPAAQPIEKRKIPQEKEPSERGNTAKRLSELTRERENIESKLSELASADSSVGLNELEKRLEEIHNDRISLLKKLRSTSVENGLNVFISYSHKDKKYLDDFKSHLKSLERIKVVKSWHDRLISAGSEWKGMIDDKLEQSDVILLLISASFIESEYCFDVELKQALSRHANNNALVVPILIRPVVWNDLPFSKLQALPSDGRAVSAWQSTDLAWVDIVEGLKIAMREFQSRKSR